MQDVPHDCLVRHLGVVGVSCINGIVLPLAHVRRERLLAVRHVRVVWLAVVLDEVRDEGVRARGIVRWIGEVQDVLDLPVREADLVLSALEQVLA